MADTTASAQTILAVRKSAKPRSSDSAPPHCPSRPAPLAGNYSVTGRTLDRCLSSSPEPRADVEAASRSDAREAFIGVSDERGTVAFFDFESSSLSRGWSSSSTQSQAFFSSPLDIAVTRNEMIQDGLYGKLDQRSLNELASG